MVAIPTYEQLALAALFAVLGHMFPVWLRFRGGKGVATGLGSFVVIAPKAVLIAAGVFIVVVAVSVTFLWDQSLRLQYIPFMAWFIGRFHAPPLGLAMICVRFPAHHP